LFLRRGEGILSPAARRGIPRGVHAGRQNRPFARLERAQSPAVPALRHPQRLPGSAVQRALVAHAVHPAGAARLVFQDEAQLADTRSGRLHLDSETTPYYAAIGLAGTACAPSHDVSALEAASLRIARLS